MSIDPAASSALVPFLYTLSFGIVIGLTIAGQCYCRYFSPMNQPMPIIQADTIVTSPNNNDDERKGGQDSGEGKGEGEVEDENHPNDNTVSCELRRLQHRYQNLKTHYKQSVNRFKALHATHIKSKATLCKLVHRHFGEQFVQNAVRHPSPGYIKRRLSNLKTLSFSPDTQDQFKFSDQ